jgi:murein DD-endopeptidase MepM/ murein hydrolase activator NlpD
MKSWILSLLLLMIWVLSACAPTPAPEPTPSPVVVLPAISPKSTLAPTSAPQPTPLCPNPECISFKATPGQPAALRLSLPTPGSEPISAWRPPQYPVPLAIGEFDHFYFARPIAADVINWPLADYRYGGTLLNPDITHTGVDIPAEAGTPILAAGPGIVIWAGWGLFTSTPENIRDPYGMAVAIRHDFGYHGQPLFTIYAHMRAVDVAVGQRVKTGEPLGEVGDTGYTTGPHLHFELRIGQNSYFFTRNPELWLAPPQGWGVLAGRVLESNREPAHSLPVLVRSLTSNREWTVNTYGPEAVNPDDYFQENMVISDLPAGKYEVMVKYHDKIDRTQIDIHPGQVAYFVYRGTFGFTSTSLPPAPTIPPTRAVTPTVTPSPSPPSSPTPTP